MRNPFLIGTRGSPLALVQTQWVIDQLKIHWPDLGIDHRVIKTTGDRTPTPPASGILKGLFTKEIEESLLKGEIRGAVHSLKDLFSELAPGLVLAALPEREDCRDCLVSVSGRSLEQLPRGATIGTSSVRRQAFLSKVRPDLRFDTMRGNVETRLKKMRGGACDALVMAYAGLKRLGLSSQATQILSFDIVLPAPGQGALAVQALTKDKQAQEILSVLDHASTRAAVTAERAFLTALEGGCQVPIGAHASVSQETLRLSGGVAGHEKVIRAEISGSLQDAEVLGKKLAQQLRDMGAKDILKELHR